MNGALLGPFPFTDDLTTELTRLGRPHQRIVDPRQRATRVAEILAQGAVLGMCSGRMEFGPRALGNRSILADPRPKSMQARLNLAVKHRESFRPFAPVVLEERSADWFDFEHPSPYMSFVAQVRGVTMDDVDLDNSGNAHSSPSERVDLLGRLGSVDSPIPAVTHVDGTARLQTADPERHPELHRILLEFEALTGCPVLVNTSFNLRGEPIVATAEDAYRCFMSTDIDWLVIDDCLISKVEQPPWNGPAPIRSPD